MKDILKLVEKLNIDLKSIITIKDNSKELEMFSDMFKFFSKDNNFKLDKVYIVAINEDQEIIFPVINGNIEESKKIEIKQKKIKP